MKKIILAIGVLFIALSLFAQVHCDSLLCIDSIDGITFWGLIGSDIGDQYPGNLRAVKFVLAGESVNILQQVDLPDTLRSKRIVFISNQSFVVKTTNNFLVSYYNGELFYSTSIYSDIKRSNDYEIYALSFDGIISKQAIDFTGGNWLGTCYDMDYASCFEVGSSNVFAIGGYQATNNYTHDPMSILALFRQEQSQTPTVFMNSLYMKVNNIIIDENNNIFALCIKETHVWGEYFDLIVYNNLGESRVAFEIFSDNLTPISMLKHNNYIYIGHYHSVRRYDLNSGSWEDLVSTDFDDYANYVLKMFLVGNQLVVSFEHGDFFLINIENESSENDIIAENIVFVNNYPNPFQSETTINFNVKKSGNVSLNIYNIKGQLIKKLMNEKKSGGIYHVKWDGRDSSGKLVSNGTYLYRLSSKEFSLTKKIVFMK